MIKIIFFFFFLPKNAGLNGLMNVSPQKLFKNKFSPFFFFVNSTVNLSSDLFFVRTVFEFDLKWNYFILGKTYSNNRKRRLRNSSCLQFKFSGNLSSKLLLKTRKKKTED